MADAESKPNMRKGGRRRRPTFRRRVVRSGLLLIGIVLMVGLSGCLERLAYFPTRGTPPPPPGVSEVTFPTEDGLTLHGWFAPARLDDVDDHGKLRAPTILVMHGNAGNVESHFGFVDFFPARGFNVFIFDYRSYGRSDSGRLNRNNLLRDAQAALAYLLDREDVDSTRIVLYAQSLGTSFGSHLMMKRPEIRAGIFMSAFTSWQDMAASALGASGDPGWLARSIASLLIRSGVDPIDALPKIGENRPVLLIHGTADEVVPFEHGRRLYRAAESAGVDVRFREVAGGDHNSLRWIDPKLADDMVRFYRDAIEKAD